MATRSDREETREKYASSRDAAVSRSSGDYTSIKIPEGMQLFKPEAGRLYLLDFIQYKAGEGNVHAKPGQYYNERTHYVHRQIGPNNETHCCLWENFRKKCPVCEYRAKLQAKPDRSETVDKLISSLKPKRRQMFLVIDAEDTKTGIQLYETSYAAFGEDLDAEIADSEESDGYDRYWHRRGGMTLRLKYKEEPGAGFKWIKISTIKFKPRDDMDLELIRGAPCLDELLKPLKYEELKEIFLQAPATDDDDDDDKGTSNSAQLRRAERAAAKEDDDDDEPDNGGARAHGGRRNADDDDDDGDTDTHRPAARRGRDDDDEPEGDDDDRRTRRRGKADDDDD